MDLFDYQSEKQKFKEAPLAARMRPTSLTDFVGHEHIVGQGRVLRRAIDAGNLPSVVLWGPPGSGKTTLANIMAQATNAFFAPYRRSAPVWLTCAASLRRRKNGAR
jgi:putative ATPase